MQVLLISVNTLFDVTNGDTFAMINGTTTRAFDEAINVEDVELSEWFTSLSPADAEILHAYYIIKHSPKIDA